MLAILLAEKAVAEGWNDEIIDAMVPAAKKSFELLMPAAATTASKLFDYFDVNRWSPRYRVEFTKKGRWLYRIATG